MTFYPVIDIYILAFCSKFVLRARSALYFELSSLLERREEMSDSIRIFLKQLFAAVTIVYGVANLVFDFGGGTSMTIAANAFAFALLNSARLDMIESKPHINITITREEKDSSEL